MNQLLTSNSRQTACCAETDTLELVEPMEEHTRIHESMFSAFSNRREEKLSYIAEFEDINGKRRELKDDYDAYFATSGGSLADFMRLTSAHDDLGKLAQENLLKKDELLKRSDDLLKDYKRTKNCLWLETIGFLEAYFTRKVL